MAKAKYNFYWKGEYIAAGSEAPNGVPKKLVEQEKPKKKARKPKVENKNAAPKTEDK